MSRIKGLNDKVTLKDKPITPGITVWKGEKKGNNRAGINLNEKFRIEAPLRLRAALKLAINATEKDGSLYVDQLNIVPAYEDEFKTFDSKMAAYNASRPILFCDREYINTEFIEQKDPFGGIYFQPIEAEKPCPVAGTNFDCPNKCARTGDFYFYIYELMELGYAEFCRLRVHGVADNQHLASVIDETKEALGVIRTSPFVSEETKTYIIYELSRRKVQSKYPVKEGGVRTAKRGTKDDWVLNLALSPKWLNRYQSYQSTQQLIAANIEPSLKLITQVYGAGLIAPASSEFVVKSLESNYKLQTPNSELWSMDESKLAELKALWQAHGWTKSALEELLYSYFDISDRAGIMQLSAEQFEELKRLSVKYRVTGNE